MGTGLSQSPWGAKFATVCPCPTLLAHVGISSCIPIKPGKEDQEREGGQQSQMLQGDQVRDGIVCVWSLATKRPLVRFVEQKNSEDYGYNFFPLVLRYRVSITIEWLAWTGTQKAFVVKDDLFTVASNAVTKSGTALLVISVQEQQLIDAV